MPPNSNDVNNLADAFKMILVSRGRGRGHAVPDMAIADELTQVVSNLAITFASYSSGAEAYRSRGYPVVDLDAPDEPPFLPMVVKEARLFGNLRPQLIVAHEEFAAPTAAKIFQIPCVFITDFFLDPNSLAMQALEFAADIVFTAQRGLYTEPPHLHGRVNYVGPAVRGFQYCIADRRQARIELGLPEDGAVVLCQPGSWSEAEVPLISVLDAAWNLLSCSPRHLVWVAGRDYEMLRTRFAERADWTILKEHWQMDQLIVASNVVITKANRLTVYEAAALGVPSISVSKAINWCDDVAVLAVETNKYLHSNNLRPDVLAACVSTAVAGAAPSVAPPVRGHGISGVVHRIIHQIEKIQAKSVSGT